MTKAHQVEHATFGYDAMVAGIGGVMGHVIETVACRSFERLYDVPVFDVHTPAPGHRKPICPKSGGHEIEAWGPPRPCPRCGEGTTERTPLAATVG